MNEKALHHTGPANEDNAAPSLESIRRVLCSPSQNEMAGRPPTIGVTVHNPGGIGGTPCVKITHAQHGFDWDSGKILLTPEVPLTALTPEQVNAISKSAKLGQSWHAYQRHKALKEEIDLLKSRLTSLTLPQNQQQAFTIADKAMEDVIRSKCGPTGKPDEFALKDDRGLACERIELADEEVRNAFDWLKTRGVASIGSEATNIIRIRKP